MLEKRFKFFYSFLFFTTFIPNFPYIIPFLPGQLFGFNWPGLAWIIMLLVTAINLAKTKNTVFPFWIWLPWLTYLVLYLVLDFSFLGLQLTLQYLLPLLIGVVAAGFSYSEDKLRWLFNWFIRLCVVTVVLFTFGYLFRGGYTPTSAATPMLLSIGASLMAGIYYMTKEKKYLLYFGLLFLVPVIDVTRMGIAAFLAIFILHFANRRVIDKILYGVVGLIVVVIVFNTKGFQEKTFHDGSGDISEIAFNYYENDELNSSGRKTWQIALGPGLLAEPIWGNGPRSDASVLGEAIGQETGEAHNDYLSVRYNYGWVGLSFLLSGLTFTFLRLFNMSFNYKEPVFQLLCLSTMTLFIGLLFFMYSDNILKYTIWFPNYFFALIGICFSLYKKGFSYE